MNSCEDTVRAYILGTHGSLPNINYEEVGNLLSDDFAFSNEEQHHDKHALLVYVFPGWSSIVEGRSEARIHTLCSDSSNSVVLAHWETDYDCRDGAIWYGTDVDISKKIVRKFQVFASFTIASDGKIKKIVQRSDTVVKLLGIEKEVQAYRNNHSAK